MGHLCFPLEPLLLPRSGDKLLEPRRVAILGPLLVRMVKLLGFLVFGSYSSIEHALGPCLDVAAIINANPMLKPQPLGNLQPSERRLRSNQTIVVFQPTGVRL